MQEKSKMGPQNVYVLQKCTLQKSTLQKNFCQIFTCKMLGPKNLYVIDKCTYYASTLYANSTVCVQIKKTFGIIQSGYSKTLTPKNKKENIKQMFFTHTFQLTGQSFLQTNFFAWPHLSTMQAYIYSQCMHKNIASFKRKVQKFSVFCITQPKYVVQNNTQINNDYNYCYSQQLTLYIYFKIVINAQLLNYLKTLISRKIIITISKL
eukprot:TRINITY_DN8278_c1_g1_i11.p4 TRINITY_DN8278_c1_g1~~TRINITY_DN8278_c1_g1_i11.p4  ORF type:complete len:207 (+),score=-11.86 TRINITY_DN8278_c1_g1_i11:669-1289(+)